MLPQNTWFLTRAMCTVVQCYWKQLTTFIVLGWAPSGRKHMQSLHLYRMFLRGIELLNRIKQILFDLLYLKASVIWKLQLDWTQSILDLKFSMPILVVHALEGSPIRGYAFFLKQHFLNIMILQLMGEKVNNHDSIAVTINCNVPCSLVFKDAHTNYSIKL